MGSSLYFQAQRSSPLSSDELQAIDDLIAKKDLGNPDVAKLFESWDADGAEGFSRFGDLSDGALLQGAIGLPVAGMVNAANHWCELLSDLRRALPETHWHVHLDDSEVAWNSSAERFELPGMEQARAPEEFNSPKNISAAAKTKIGREICAQFEGEGFTWLKRNSAMERTSGDFLTRVWFRPLAGNAEVDLKIYSPALQEWTTAQALDLFENEAARLGYVASYHLQVVEWQMSGGPLAWTGVLTGRTVDDFRNKVPHAIRKHGFNIEAKYLESPDAVWNLHEELDNHSPYYTDPRLEYYLWQDRRDLAERTLEKHLDPTSKLSSKNPKWREKFLAAVADPASVDHPPYNAVLAHRFGLHIEV